MDGAHNSNAAAADPRRGAWAASQHAAAWHRRHPPAPAPQEQSLTLRGAQRSAEPCGWTRPCRYIGKKARCTNATRGRLSAGRRRARARRRAWEGAATRLWPPRVLSLAHREAELLPVACREIDLAPCSPDFRRFDKPFIGAGAAHASRRCSLGALLWHCSRPRPRSTMGRAGAGAGAGGSATTAEARLRARREMAEARAREDPSVRLSHPRAVSQRVSLVCARPQPAHADGSPACAVCRMPSGAGSSVRWATARRSAAAALTTTARRCAR